MIMTDPIADMFTRVRSVFQARHETVGIPVNREKVEVAKILKNEGFITDYTADGDVKKTITVAPKYGLNNEKVVDGLKRISKPGLRVYARMGPIPRIMNGLGTAVISTSHDMIADGEVKARYVGGEVIAYVR